MGMSHMIYFMFLVVTDETPKDACNPSPCGSNADCNNGVCTCQPGYNGDPYAYCRPECLVSVDCPMDKACVRNKCVNPCTNTCGQSAICQVNNHAAICTCPPSYTGNAFIKCSPTGK